MMAANNAVGGLACETRQQLLKEHSIDSHEPRITCSYLCISHIGLGVVLILALSISTYIFVRRIFPYYRLESYLTTRVYGTIPEGSLFVEHVSSGT